MLQMQVAAAELRCTTSTHQSTQLQRVSEEQLQQLQSAEAATADASSRAAAALATNGDLQRQLSGALRQCDDFSRLVTERHAPVTTLTVCVNNDPCCMQWYRTHHSLCNAPVIKKVQAPAASCGIVFLVPA